MLKRKLTSKDKLNVKLPPYNSNHNAWRRLINKNVKKEAKSKGFGCRIKDYLELNVCFYFFDNKKDIIDIDNRLKDVMDALQGYYGGFGKKHENKKRFIDNDNQIYRVTVEKRRLSSKQPENLGGHLFISKYKGHSK